MSDCTRRNFFAQLGLSVLDRAETSVRSARAIFSEQVSPSPETPIRDWLRPPGALPENEFRRACTQCNECITACPYDAIRRLGPEFGIDAGTPAVIPHESPCYLCDDMPCIVVCEPGALRPTPKSAVRMGVAEIDKDACYVTQGQRCDYCMVRCPLGTTAIVAADGGMPQIHESGCSGCGVCDYLCPADAIRIIPTISSDSGAV